MENPLIEKIKRIGKDVLTSDDLIKLDMYVNRRSIRHYGMINCLPPHFQLNKRSERMFPIDSLIKFVQKKSVGFENSGRKTYLSELQCCKVKQLINEQETQKTHFQDYREVGTSIPGYLYKDIQNFIKNCLEERQKIKGSYVFQSLPVSAVLRPILEICLQIIDLNSTEIPVIKDKYDLYKWCKNRIKKSIECSGLKINERKRK